VTNEYKHYIVQVTNSTRQYDWCISHCLVSGQTPAYLADDISCISDSGHHLLLLVYNKISVTGTDNG